MFWRHKPIANTRSDGYKASTAQTICHFQAMIERESDCDYSALRAALLWARNTEKPICILTLRQRYNDSRFEQFR